MSGRSTTREKLATLAKRADWLEQRIGGNATGYDYDRAELSALRWAIGKLDPDRQPPGRPERSSELYGVDFAVVAARHGEDCGCDADRQVVAYPVTAARVVVRSDARTQLVVDFSPDQDDYVAVDADTYRAALAGLIADEAWQPEPADEGPVPAVADAR